MDREDNCRLTLVYLAREAEGLAPVEAFLRSYRKLPPGIDHKTLVVCKGADDSYIASLKERFGDIDATYMQRSDEGMDIHAYLDAVRLVETPWACFLNTFTIVKKPFWLEKLYAATRDPAVGLVGATGSYESLMPSLRLHRWFYNRLASGVVDAETLHLFCWLQKVSEGTFAPPEGTGFGVYLRRFSKWHRNKWHAEHLQIHRTGIVAACDMLIAQLENIPGFPNPHIRTNGFLVRADFLRDNFINIGPQKTDAYGFESGPKGLSLSVLNAGMTLKLVGDAGAYDIADWAESKTFRSGNQEHLLLGDNQTDFFDALSEDAKELFRYLTWGDRAVAPHKFAYAIPEALKCVFDTPPPKVETNSFSSG